MIIENYFKPLKAVPTLIKRYSDNPNKLILQIETGLIRKWIIDDENDNYTYKEIDISEIEDIEKNQ